jgi:hypothetical protein
VSVAQNRKVFIELILSVFQMLMKHTQVSREGIVTDPPLAQLTYGALLSGRIAMVADSSNTAKKVSIPH